MKIDVDVHEPGRVVAALRQLGMRVTVRRLSIGDYEFERETVAERKTIADLRASLRDGRLWHQIGALRRSRIAYLVLEGPDVVPALRDADSVRGAVLAVTDLGVTVIRSRDCADTAAWLALIAKRRAQAPIRRRSPHVGRPRAEAHPASIRVLAGIEGVSETRAASLLERFGTIAAIASASVSDLTETPGVHTTIATRIYDSLH